MRGGYCALPLPRSLNEKPLRSNCSTASMTKCTKSSRSTHSRKSHGKSIGVCRSTFTSFAPMPDGATSSLRVHSRACHKVRQSAQTGAPSIMKPERDALLVAQHCDHLLRPLAVRHAVDDGGL